MGASLSPGLPALERFLQDEYGGRFNVKVSTTGVTTAVTLVVKHDFERMGLSLINIGGASVSLTPGLFVATSTGIILQANGGFLSLTARDDLVLVGWEWYGLANTGTSSLEVIEVTRYAALGG